MLRRHLLLFGGAGLALDLVGADGRMQPRRRLDLSGYRQTFAAEFNDPIAPLSINDGGPFTTRYEQWGGLRTLPANGELELYVDKTFAPALGGTDKAGHADARAGEGKPLGYDPFVIRNGCLDIIAVSATAAQRKRVDKPYLSGMISTEWSFTQRYGYFEIRAQLPSGRGLWPAFWMVSNTAAEHVEIDVFEAIGQPDRVYHSVHFPAAWGPGFHLAAAPRPGFDYSDGMHTYGALWTEQELVFFIDGTESARTVATPLRAAPPMYLIANLAVGGTWPGTPPPETHFPATMRIDYIRAYRRL